MSPGLKLSSGNGFLDKEEAKSLTTSRRTRLLYRDLTQPDGKPLALIDDFDSRNSPIGIDGPVFYDLAEGREAHGPGASRATRWARTATTAPVRT